MRMLKDCSSGVQLIGVYVIGCTFLERSRSVLSYFHYILYRPFLFSWQNRRICIAFISNFMLNSLVNYVYFIIKHDILIDT